MDALAAGRWVLDPTGANQLFSDGLRTPQPGSDPLLDALQVLKYVRDAAGEAAAVVKFNPEASNYRPKFDPFPHPRGDVIRYDFIPPTLTPVDPNTSGASAFRLPGVRFFRRMSVYVDGGKVVEVRERISVKDMLEDPVSNIATRIGDYGIEFPQDASLREQAALLLESLNAQSGPSSRRFGFGI
jgi:hypothetical protein